MAKPAKGSSGSGKDALSRLNSVKSPSNEAAVQTVCVQMVDLRKMDTKALVERLTLDSTRGISVLFGQSKIVAALDEKRDPEQDKTLRKFVSKFAPKLTLETSVYQGAIAFREMVSDIAPEKGATFHGKIVEADFDATPFWWLKIVSAIFNTLSTKHKDNDELISATREMVAVVLRTHPKDGKAQLTEILKALRPESEKTGEKEEEGAEPVGFTDEEVRLLMKALMLRIQITTDLGALQVLSTALPKLAAIAAAGIESAKAASETPAPVEVPAQAAA